MWYFGGAQGKPQGGYFAGDLLRHVLFYINTTAEHVKLVFKNYWKNVPSEKSCERVVTKVHSNLLASNHFPSTKLRAQHGRASNSTCHILVMRQWISHTGSHTHLLPLSLWWCEREARISRRRDYLVDHVMSNYTHFLFYDVIDTMRERANWLCRAARRTHPCKLQIIDFIDHEQPDSSYFSPPPKLFLFEPTRCSQLPE